MSLDRRLNPYRRDLAAAWLEGRVEAARYVAGRRAQVRELSAPVHDEPRFTSKMTTEALRGETVLVFEEAQGWAWVQLEADGYVGYVPAVALSADVVEATVEVAVPRTFVFGEPAIKARPLAPLSLGCRLSGAEHDEAFVAIDGGGYVLRRHLRSLGEAAGDWVAVAEWFQGTPYLWGGRQSTGLDCSGLVQLAARAGGHAAPRDSDMQRDGLGRPLDAEQRRALRRGDLVFWTGHVGIMRDAHTLLHANAFHMMCVSEPLAEAVSRIAHSGLEIEAINRLD
jgi:cell wall-associated NlpC family hydrolase